MNLGLKIEGAQMEVGFTVSSLAEFAACVSRLTVMAEALWPPTDAAPSEAKAKVESPTRSDDARLIAEEKKNWRDAQGLR